MACLSLLLSITISVTASPVSLALICFHLTATACNSVQFHKQLLLPGIVLDISDGALLFAQVLGTLTGTDT